MLKKLIVLGSVAAMSAAMTIAHAEIINDPTPHFYVQMENQSDKEVSISFKPGNDHVSLTPGLADHTPLPAHQQSAKYGVVFAPLGKDDSFDIIFTGKKDCAITLSFFAPGNPKIVMAGYGCNGAGYKIADERTVLLYVTNIHVKS